MKIEWERWFISVFLSYLSVFSGNLSDALQYDYSAIVDCLAEPQKPQYNGGIIVNWEINDGLRGWTAHGDVKIEARRSSITSNKFIVAHTRAQPNASVSHSVFLHKDNLYTFSAWIQVTGKGDTPVVAIFKTSEGQLLPAGSVVARVGCWSMLKGGLTVPSSGLAQLYFESNDTSVEIWLDSVSLQPFTPQEWRSHHDQSIEKIRKSKVRIQVIDTQGKPVQRKNISLAQKGPKFPFGASINKDILTNPSYQNWFLKRFKVATFENEMKWYSTEQTQGKEDYSTPDAMLNFTTQHNISVRGHNIFWDDPNYQPWWVKNLSPSALSHATNKRLYSIVSRYSGKLIAWDVNNENLNFNFFESKLGNNISNKFFRRTRQFDRQTSLFINDYNTIEDERDHKSSPSNYVRKLKEIQAYLGVKHPKLGIGLEGHFGTPNPAYIRSSLDTLASTGHPIWITELDVQGQNQAEYFEQILREVHAHPGIKGIVIWGPWSPNGQCYRMCLVDANFNNLGPGSVLDKLLAEWGHGHVISGSTDENGYFNTSLFHGTYEVELLQQEGVNKARAQLLDARSLIIDHGSSNQIIKIVSE